MAFESKADEKASNSFVIRREYNKRYGYEEGIEMTHFETLPEIISIIGMGLVLIIVGWPMR